MPGDQAGGLLGDQVELGAQRQPVAAAYRQAGGTPKRLIGSGNGLRQNRYLQQCFETAFSCPLTLSDGREEAAAGAAQFAAEQQI